ncbi:MAG: GNAT family N-acetyltransferase [Bacillota bacterium]
MTINIETTRLLLRVLTIEDIDAVTRFWGNEEVMKYCGGVGTRESRLKAIEFYSNLQREKGFSPFAVILKEINEVIGACGFNPTPNDREIELIYHFAKDYWGKGYATEAAKACIEYVRKSLQMNKIVAAVDPNHTASRNVLEKVGFQYKGVKWFEDTQQDEPYFELILSNDGVRI